jgi:DNA-damage-inducible protein J
MSSETTVVRARIEPELKIEATEILHSMGLNMTDAITLFLKSVVNVRALPFEVKAPQPNKETIKAMSDARNGNVKYCEDLSDLL